MLRDGAAFYLCSMKHEGTYWPKSLIVWLLIGSTTFHTMAQQVVVSDSLLLARNAAIAAARAEVEARRGEVVTVGTWDNPTIEVEQNVYNRLNSRWFDFGRQSEQVVALQQPLPTMGRTHRRAAAEAEVERAQAALILEERQQLLALHRLAIGLWYVDEARRLLEVSMGQVRRLAEGVERQAEWGQVAGVDVIRIKALASDMAREAALLDDAAEEAKRTVAILVGEANGERLRISTKALFVDSARLEQLLEAYDLTGRPAVRMAAAEATAARQRQQAADMEGVWPQVALTASYDRAGNFIENYFAVGASVTLPLWNRGQGVRRTAQYEAEASELRYTISRMEAENGRLLAEGRLRRIERLLREAPQVRDEMLTNVADAYARHDIGLVEFLDHFEGLRAAALLALELRRDMLLAREDLLFEL